MAFISHEFRTGYKTRGRVSKVEMAAPRVLIYKELFPSISTFETPPKRVMASGTNGFPGEKEKFRTPAERSDVDNPHTLIYLYS
jgi:hypothetical protein